MKKLFYEDTHILDFTAVITNCSTDEKRRGIWLELDQTAFFPEEGGQSADKGTINGLNVLDVQIKNDIICHLVQISDPTDCSASVSQSPEEDHVDTFSTNTKSSFSPGQTITGHVDWQQRFDFMQQHSGEHILSGLLHNHFGFRNVGFHLGATEATMDFDQPISLEMLREIEKEANEIIWKNLPVHTYFPTKEELAVLEYRSKIDIEGDVRIVEIPGVDICACCAPHVERTGEIGMIKILSAQSHRGGVRIHILCGSRALQDYTFKQDTCSRITARLSASPDQLVSGVERIMEESNNRKQARDKLAEQMLQLQISLLPAPEDNPHPILFTELDNPVAVRNAVNSLCEKYSGYVSAFSGNDLTGYRFIIGSSSMDCRNVASLLRSALQAKGGGTPPMVQGSVQANASSILSIMESIL